MVEMTKVRSGSLKAFKGVGTQIMTASTSSTLLKSVVTSTP